MKNILFLSPHLSTGGMPQFLLERVNSIINFSNINVYVIEINNISDTYVVQKNKLSEILGDNLISYGNIDISKKHVELYEFLNSKNIDIIHIEDNIECINGIDQNFINVIYDDDRRWKVVETCHNSWFNISNKRYFPDGYSHCTYDQVEKFNSNISINSLVEYPVYKKEIDMDTDLDNPYDSNKINILSVGLWSRNKNHKNTINIAKNIKNDKIVFNIVGNYADNFKDYWEETFKDIPSNVKIWGEQNDLDKFYKNADIFLFNSLDECNPISIKEAISYNLPLIIRNLPIYNNRYNNISNFLNDDIDNNILQLNDLIDKIKNGFEYEYEYDTQYYFYKKNIDLYNRCLYKKSENINIDVSFIDGVKCTINGFSKYKYITKFINNDTNEIIYQTILESNQWASPNIKYFINWRVEVTSDNPNFEKFTKYLDLSNKNIHISFESSSIGDTIAWFPYIKLFQEKHKCKVYVNIFNEYLFDSSDFIKINSKEIDTIYASYKIGCYNNINLNPNPWNEVPLGKVCSDILGLYYNEIKPILSESILNIEPFKIGSKYVVISTNSTAKMKLWNNENGWQELVDYLNNKGYVVINISNDVNRLKNVIYLKDDSIIDTIKYIKGSSFFIGLSSGLSWISWCLDKKVFIINGFIEDYSDFTENCYKIKNKSVCNSCWNKVVFDKNYNTCVFKEIESERFQCSKSITSKMVIETIEKNI